MSKTVILVKEIRRKAMQRYDEKIGYASRAFLPFVKCERNNVTFFVSSVKLPETKSVEMIRTF